MKITMVKFLLERGVHCSQNCDIAQFLSWVAGHGFEETMKELINNGILVILYAFFFFFELFIVIIVFCLFIDCFYYYYQAREI